MENYEVNITQHSYDLVLLDLDGLLIGSEHLHYQAWRSALTSHGIEFDMSFADFKKSMENEGINFDQVLTKYYAGYLSQRDNIIKAKAKITEELIETYGITMLDGAADLLDRLANDNVQHAVVTNSPRSLVTRIRRYLPELSTIPHWFVREDYNNAKPSPDCYKLAIETLSPGGRVIGFEDSVQGAKALLDAGSDIVMVNDSPPPAEIEDSVVYRMNTYFDRNRQGVTAYLSDNELFVVLNERLVKAADKYREGGK
jgi:HAD superfamily hydrolase (TIGR01509 family)